MGRNARPGAYDWRAGEMQIGGALIPVLVEVWTLSKPVRDRKTPGAAGLDTLFVNRTPALILRQWAGTVDVLPPTT